MIDIKWLRDNVSSYKEVLQARNSDIDLDNFLELDNKRNTLLNNIQNLRSKLNLKTKPSAKSMADLKASKENLKVLENDFEQLDKNYQIILKQMPNIYAPDTVLGGEENNVIESVYGTDKTAHYSQEELLYKYNLVDFKKGAQAAGSKFFYGNNTYFKLFRAMTDMALEILEKYNFKIITVPYMVNEDIAAGTGYLPHDQQEQNYRDTAQGMVMIATAEMPLTAYHKDDLLDLSKPKLYAALSPCYRLEAGSYGKYSTGLYRVHQFEKLEMYGFAASQDSDQVQQLILKIEKEIAETLNINYRVVRSSVGDLSAAAYKKYDIEYLSIHENIYHELTSCSNCSDFQARRLNIRYIDSEGQKRYAHTVNGTAITSSRSIIAYLENNQDDKGNILITEGLYPYYKKETL